MPVWMEILLNVIGYAGFVAVATFHKPSGEPPRDGGKRRQLAFCGSPAVRISRSALTRTRSVSGCGRSEKLMATKATQNNKPITITRRWVRLSAL